VLLEVVVLRPVALGEIPQATAGLAWKVHAKGTDEMRVRDVLGPLFADEDFTAEAFAGMYPEHGQPAISPALLAMVTVLQFLHRLSDRDAVIAVADRISWKYVLGLELDAEAFDASVLCEFRARVAETGRADALFGVMIEKLKAQGLVRARGRARTDSTHVLGAVRVLNRIELVGESVRVALEEIAGLAPAVLVALLDAGWAERYGHRVELGRLLGRGSAKTSADKLAAQIAADGAALLGAIDADPAARWLNLLPAVALLREVWAQQIEADGAGGSRLIPAERLAPSAGRVHSPHDPEVRYSTKGRGHEQDLEWVGSKAHLTESCDDDLPHLVTDVYTSPATDPDVSATGTIRERLEGRGLAPGQWLLDAGYPSPAHLTEAADNGTALIAPITSRPGRNAKTGLYTPYDFQIDWDAGHATCPAGAVSRSMKPDKRGLTTFAFSRRDCTPCPLRDQCTRTARPSPRRLTVPPQPIRDAVITARTAQDTDDWKALYNKRAGIEGTISQAVRGPDLRHARYRGLAKTHLQNVFTGIAINLSRLGAHYDRPTPPRRPTRVSTLCHQLGLTTA
jgi:transposase